MDYFDGYLAVYKSVHYYWEGRTRPPPLPRLPVPPNPRPINPSTRDPTEPFSKVSIRRLVSNADFQACLQLQREIWGGHFVECVPPTILNVAQRIGGVTAGAFDAEGRLLGFVFGMTGVESERLVHWSDMLAVREEARNFGIGRRLKEFQRKALLPLGVEVIYWTFDPLVTRNAHLNLNRLGARVGEYVADMYGETDSDLHRGIGTDRLVVAWPIRPLSGEPTSRRGYAPGFGWEDTPVLTELISLGKSTGFGAGAPLSASRVRIEVPPDIRELQATVMEAAVRWRMITREAFDVASQQDYRVCGFYRESPGGRCFYLLEASSPKPEETSCFEQND
jgi:predicted GNAT superfamily acetyltransferase